MRSIRIDAEQLEYTGVFAAPPFALLSTPEAAVEGLYRAFAGLHHGLDSIEAHAPSEPRWAVDLGDSGTYRLGLARIEWTRAAAWSVELDTGLLARGDAWLRSVLPGPLMSAHHYTYSAHASLGDGSAADTLRRIGGMSLPEMGESLGTGLIFHGRFPEGWYVRFTLDHSQVVEGGLFFQILASVAADAVDHRAVGPFLLHRVHGVLARLGLHVENGVG